MRDAVSAAARWSAPVWHTSGHFLLQPVEFPGHFGAAGRYLVRSAKVWEGNISGITIQ